MIEYNNKLNDNLGEKEENLRENFSRWLSEQANNRGWSHRELGRRAGISQTQVSGVIEGSRRPGWDFCAGIAKALGEPPLKIFHMAGLLTDKDISESGLSDSAKIDMIWKAIQRQAEQPPSKIISYPEDSPDKEFLGEIWDQLGAMDKRSLYDYAMWRYREMHRPRNSSGERYSLDIKELIEIIPKMTPEEREQLINLLLSLPGDNVLPRAD